MQSFVLGLILASATLPQTSELPKSPTSAALPDFYCYMQIDDQVLNLESMCAVSATPKIAAVQVDESPNRTATQPEQATKAQIKRIATRYVNTYCYTKGGEEDGAGSSRASIRAREAAQEYAEQLGVSASEGISEGSRRVSERDC